MFIQGIDAYAKGQVRVHVGSDFSHFKKEKTIVPAYISRKDIEVQHPEYHFSGSKKKAQDDNQKNQFFACGFFDRARLFNINNFL